MPAKPSWYGRLDEIVAALEALPRPFVDRAAVESLLGVGPRRAQQILAPCVRERVGSSGLADRQELVAHLRRLAAGDAVHYERQRRRKVAGVLERWRRAWLEQPPVFVEAPASVVNQRWETLPEGIQVAPGAIRVEFASPQEALEKLLALAMAIGNDLEGFQQLSRK